MNIGRGVINNQYPRVVEQTWDKLRSLNILANATIRGSRGGVNKPRYIKVRITPRTNHPNFANQACRDYSVRPNHVNRSNLVAIKTVETQSHSAPRIRLAHWNARSLKARKKKNKAAALCDFVITHQLDICAVSETWFTGQFHDNRAIADINNTLPHFKLHHIPRPSKGGGVGVFIRDGVSYNTNEVRSYQSFEYLDVSAVSMSKSMRLIVIYRPPKSKKNKLPFTLFLEEFSSLLESLALLPNLLLTGDFNVHVNDKDDPDAASFMELLDLFHLQQHVVGPTHNKGNTLDLIISRIDEELVRSPSTHHDLPSDHSAIKCFVDMMRPAPSVKKVVSRKIRSIDKEAFKRDIRESSLLTSPPEDLERLTLQYSATLSELLDQHAPLLQRSVFVRPHAPWYNDTLRSLKQEKRRWERKWLKSKLQVDKAIFKEKSDEYQKCLTKAKTEFHQSEICESDPKNLLKVVDKLSNPRATQSLPSHDCAKSLADNFAEFFVDKVRKFRDELDNSPTPPPSINITESCQHTFSAFSPVTKDDVLKIIKASSVTSCSLDPIPASLLKSHLQDLLPTITTIVNESLSTGAVPSSLKHACIRPLLKKAGLDQEVNASYRPISNLPYVGKVIERVAVSQLQGYLTDNNLHPRMQSAYKRHHSTETALLRVQNDLLSALDKRQEALLVLLDFSAAFDTIDHRLLFRRLTTRYGIQGTALKWIKSYMSDRTQSVIIGDKLSDAQPLVFGVPKDQSLDLFCLLSTQHPFRISLNRMVFSVFFMRMTPSCIWYSTQVIELLHYVGSRPVSPI